MAYENMTYEYILQRMMTRVSEKYPDLDNREGSIIFNALAPAAIELAIMYTELDNVLNESFVETASRDYLLLACEQVGMYVSVFNASAGVHKAQFDEYVEIDSQWNCELYNYTVTEYIGVEDGKHTYHLICETEGADPNQIIGDLTPITGVYNNLTYAKLVECVIEGENETSNDEIRLAYKEFVGNDATDGNIHQYERWCMNYDGIGNYKIFPLWDGTNTVKVSILSSSNDVASDELIAEFQEYLDPNCSGLGDGVAPIGSFVTVSTAETCEIEISARVTMKGDYSDTSAIDAALTKYFAEIAYKKNVVSYFEVGAIILGVEGVESIDDLLLNNASGNIELGEEIIPVLVSTEWR